MGLPAAGRCCSPKAGPTALAIHRAGRHRRTHPHCGQTMAGEQSPAAWSRPHKHAQAALCGIAFGTYHATSYTLAPGDLPATGTTGREPCNPAYLAGSEDYLHSPGEASLRRAGKLLPGVDAADCPPFGYRQSYHGWLHAELLAV